MAKQAAKKSKQNRRKRGRRLLLPALLLALPLCLLCRMSAVAQLVHLCPADVYLEDLPAAFDGARLLFVSDLNIQGAADGAHSAALFKKLATLSPDLLLLGGDYVRSEDPDGAQAFFEALAAFEAPLGKFAVAGEADENTSSLETALGSAGVALLTDACATVERGGEALIIAGLSDVSRNETPYADLGRAFSGEECVLVLSHNPSAYVGVRVAEARGGGAWADLVLAGHNLGGQIRLFGRTMRTLPPEEARCLAGWFYEGDLPMLVSQGVRCPGLPLRLGSRSEVWLLTLRRA